MDERPNEHMTIGLVRWVIFLCMSALMIAAVAAAIVAVWRWIF